MKKSFLLLLFLVLFGINGFAEKITLFYKDGKQEKITVPEKLSNRPTADFWTVDFWTSESIEADGAKNIFIVSVLCFEKKDDESQNEITKEEIIKLTNEKEADKQAIKKLSAQIGDGIVEEEDLCSTITRYSFRIKDEIEGIKIE